MNGARIAMSPVTMNDVLNLPRDGRRTELVRGELVREPPAGGRHGGLAAELLLRIGGFVRQHGLGRSYAAETGFLLRRNPDTVRAPDFAFLGRERAEVHGRAAGFIECAPELVAEVLSPTDRLGSVRDKIADWLAAGTRVVLIVDPLREAVWIHRAASAPIVLTTDETLEIADVLPGFSCRIAELFAAG